MLRRGFVGRLFVALRQKIGSLGITDVRAAVAPSDEPEAGCTDAISTDSAPDVVADLVSGDVEQLREPFFDVVGSFDSDHAPIGPVPSDGENCPLEVGIEGTDVVLLARSERLGVLLTAPTARALGLSLLAAAEEVLA